MRLLLFAAAAGVALLALGCSKPADISNVDSTTTAKGPTVEVVHLPGVPPPVLVRVAQPGVAGEACANNDGPAVQLTFQVESELPTISVRDESVTKLTLAFGPPLVGNQQLHIRVNTTLAKLKDLKQWSIGNPDTDGGLLAWTCPVNGYPCDFAVSGTVTFTSANDQVIEGRVNLLFQSKNTVAGHLSAKLNHRIEQSEPALCG